MSKIAEELNISPRQIAKMKEVERKASPEVMEAFTEGTISLNQAYNQMKEEIKPAEEKVEVQEEVTTETTSVEVTPVKPKKTLSVAEYVMNLVMSTVQTTPATDSVSEKETA